MSSSVLTAEAALAATGLTALAIDLWLLRRGRGGVRQAVIASIGWLVVGLAFAAVVRATLGRGAAGEYITVFLLEKSLSLDNVAVFAVVLSAFAIPVHRRPKVLLGGVLAAVVLRLAFVAGGLALVDALHGVLVVFGVVLLVAGVRMARQGPTHNAGSPRVVRWLQRRRIPPVTAALLALAITDVVFAIDSVPAAFAVTRDAVVVMSANVFAVLGLRPLYDLLAAAMDRLVHLERALGVLLGLIGVALVLSPWVHVPEPIILAAVVVTLAVGVLLSLVPPRRLLVTIAGAMLLLAGAAMLVLPGPGLLVIAGGLALLATEFIWARRLLDRVRERLPKRASKSRADRDTPVQHDSRTPSAR